MPNYKVRQLRADLKEALDAAQVGEHVQINRGQDIFLLVMAPGKNLLDHELEVEAGDAPPNAEHHFFEGEIEKARGEIHGTSILKLRELLEIQGRHGNWNYDSYMRGMYNGMEVLMACLENREPEFKHTTTYLVDLPRDPNDLSEGGEVKAEEELQQ